MKRLYVLTAFALIAVVVALTVTSVSVLSGYHLKGNMLLLHMMASGVMVFGLPVFGVVGYLRLHGDRGITVFPKFVFWAAMLTGFFTIATVFLCMLPVASTEMMHELVFAHRLVGFSMSGVAVLLVVSLLKLRRGVMTPSKGNL